MIGRTLWYPKHLRKDWRDKLKVGDVLKSAGGNLRVIRDVTYRSNGFLLAVDLSIKACSWTKRCYTTVNRSDLSSRDFRPTKATVTLNTRLDRLILEDIKTHTRNLACHQVLTLP